MSGSVNKAILIGNLGRDPELRHAGDNPVCNFSLATNESWKDKSGEKQERVEWHTIVAWGKLAEICAEYLSKGRSVYVEGRIQTREYTDKEGNRKWKTEIVARDVQFIGGANNEERRPVEDGPPPPGFDGGIGGPNNDDDIPF